MTDFLDVVMPPLDHGTGCLPRSDRCGDVFPVLEDSGIELIDRADWPAFITERQADLVDFVKNQGQTDQCASNATASAVGHRIRTTCGVRVDLSPSSIYNAIQSGPGGSTISDNLRQIRDVGCLPNDTAASRELLRLAGLDPTHVMPPAVYYRQMTAAQKETAAHFRGGEWFDVRNFEGMVSAILLGFPVVYGRKAHAIYGCGVRWVSGHPRILYLNSWGQWGGPAGEFTYGFGEDSEQLLRNAIPQYGAWALRTWTVSDALLQLAI